MCRGGDERSNDYMARPAKPELINLFGHVPEFGEQRLYSPANDPPEIGRHDASIGPGEQGALKAPL